MPTTDIFGIKFKVAENGPNAAPRIELLWLNQLQGNEDKSSSSIGNKSLFLRFTKTVTFEEAQAVAREMNAHFDSLLVLNT